MKNEQTPLHMFCLYESFVMYLIGYLTLITVVSKMVYSLINICTCSNIDTKRLSKLVHAECIFFNPYTNIIFISV